MPSRTYSSFKSSCARYVLRCSLRSTLPATFYVASSMRSGISAMKNHEKIAQSLLNEPSAALVITAKCQMRSASMARIPAYFFPYFSFKEMNRR